MHHGNKQQAVRKCIPIALWQAPGWQPLSLTQAKRLPRMITQWLFLLTSMTKKIHAALGKAPRFIMHGQQVELPVAADRELLALSCRQFVMTRYITLTDGAVPLVHARTVIPLSFLVGKYRPVLLPQKPYAHSLFRQPWQSRQLVGFSHHPASPCVEGYVRRRSRFVLGRHAIVITEQLCPSLWQSYD